MIHASHWSVWRLLMPLLAALVLGSSCGGAGGGGVGDDSSGAAPAGGGSSSPIPIEMPSVLSIGVSEHSGTSNIVVPLDEDTILSSTSKAVPGSNTVEQGLYPLKTINTVMDILFGHFAGIPLDGTTSGTNTAGESYTLDFSAFTFPAFSNQEVTSVDCSQTCSGTATTLPVCVAVTMNSTAFWQGIFTTLPDADTGSKGAGCFRTTTNFTSSTSLTTLLNGTESLLLSGIWDHADPVNPTTELYWSTTATDSNGIGARGFHAHLAETGAATSSTSVNSAKATTENLVTASLFGTVDDKASASISTHKNNNIDACFVRDAGKIGLTGQVFMNQFSNTCLAGSASTTGCSCTTSAGNIPEPADAADYGQDGGSFSSELTFFTDLEFSASTDLTNNLTNELQGSAIDDDDIFENQWTALDVGTTNAGRVTMSTGNASVKGRDEGYAALVMRSNNVLSATNATTQMAVGAKIHAEDITSDGERLYFVMQSFGTRTPTQYGFRWGGGNSPEYVRHFATGTTDYTLEEAGTTTYSDASICVCFTRDDTVFKAYTSHNCSDAYTEITGSSKTIPTTQIGEKIEIVFGGFGSPFNNFAIGLDYLRFSATATCPVL